VITDDQVASLFAKANPVPSLALLDPIGSMNLEHLEDRSGRSRGMTELKTIQEPKAEPRRPRWLVPALVAALALVIAIPVYLSRQSPVADDSTPAEGIALAYLEALASNDVNTLQEIVSPTASDVDTNDQSGILAWQAAVGIVITRLGCTEVEQYGADGAVVHCPWVYDSKWHHAVGLEPSSMLQVFHIRDGKIQDESETNSRTPDLAQMWESFRSWVEENHPEDVTTMYTTSSEDLEDSQTFYNNGIGANNNTSAESIALWEQYTDEFVAEMGG
jgi:hypothetical protein